jgi:hypothetical protein
MIGKKKVFSPVKNNLTQQEIEKPSEKKIKKKCEKPIWNDSYRLINISFPEILTPNEKLKRKYKIKLVYSDNKGNRHNKTIRFGKHGKEDYLDNKNEENKKKITAKLSNTHNLFHPNYWRLNILNSGDDLKKNWINLINKLSL